MSGTCARCRHFVDDPKELERRLAGLTILSSAYGDTRGAQGLCEVHDRFLDPNLGCDRFEPASKIRSPRPLSGEASP